jgi:predicted nucleotidyltransferase
VEIEETQRTDDLRALARKIGEESGAVRVYLFGSWARKTNALDSDVDLALVFAEGVDRFEAVLREQKALWPRRQALDLVAFTEGEISEGRSMLARAVAREGELLYSRESGA